MLAAASWRQALQALRETDNLHPWQLRETQMGPYLALEAVPLEKPPSGTHGAAAAPALLDYHICYSHSYQVPVMHLRAVSLDTGLPLAPDAVAALFPSWPQRPEQLMGFVGLQEHPLLPGPCWLALHPCNTGVALALALELGGAALVAAAAEDGAEEEAATAAVAAVAGAAVAAATAVEQCSGGAAAGAMATMSGAVRTGADPGAAGGRQVAAEGGGAGGGGAGAGDGGGCRGEQGNEETAIPDVDDLLAAMAVAQSQAGAAQPLQATRAQVVEDGMGQSGVAGRSRGGISAGADGEAGGGTARAWAVVGPAGVRWPGGEVPVCPGEPAWLARYMRAWLALVAPHVGLRAGP